MTEYNKSKAYKNAFTRKLKGQKTEIASLIFILLTSSISISLSYFGAPKFVEVATPKPILNDIDQHKKQASIEADSITNFYESHIEKGEKKATEIHDKMNRKGRTRSSAIPLIVAIEKGNKQHRDSLHNALSMHNVQVQVQEQKLITENEQIEKEHKAFLKMFGVYAALVTLIIEALILLSVFWCIYYRFRSYKELGGVSDINVGNINKEPVKAKEVPKEPQKIEMPPPPLKAKEKPAIKKKLDRECLHCGDPFTPKRHDQKYCKKTDKKGRTCKTLAFYERRKETK